MMMILEQALFPAICCISSNNFVVHQDSAPAHRSHNTVALIAYLRSNVPLPLPAFIEPENWPPNSPTLNLADYSVWEA